MGRLPESPLERALAGISDGVLVADAEKPDLPVVYLNEGFTRLTGYDPEEVLGSNCRFLQGVDSDPAAIEAMSSALREGRGCRATLLNYRKDGSPFWNEVTLSPVRDDVDRLTHFAGTLRDVTDAMEDVAALRNSEEELRRIVTRLADAEALAGVGSWEVDVATGEVLWSDEVYRQTGLDPDTVVPSFGTFIGAVHPDDRELVQEVILRARADHKPFAYQLRFVRPDGTERIVDCRGKVATDGRGGATRLIGTSHDITEQVSGEREKAQLEDRLRHTERLESIGRLAGGIAHDFNNLLSVILNSASFAVQGLDEASPVRADVEEIRRAAERAARLTGQLLTFSRREVVKPTVLDVGAVIGGMEELLRRTLGEDLRLLTRIPAELAAVEMDRGQFEQVILNLAVNARDAMPEGGALSITGGFVELAESMDRAGRFVRIEVADAGHGMSEAVAAHAFEPFFTTKGPGRGTGLGLATVHGAVERHGGHVELRSAPGEGTVVRVFLPATDRAPEPVRVPKASHASGEASETILLVEDQDQLRKLLRRVLAEEGFNVVEARNGEEALLHCSESGSSIDLMLTDVVMPDISGKEVVDRAHAMDPRLKAVFMSGYTDDILVRHGVEQGAPFLRKPFTSEVLLSTVEEVLKGDGRG